MMISVCRKMRKSIFIQIFYFYFCPYMGLEQKQELNITQYHSMIVTYTHFYFKHLRNTRSTHMSIQSKSLVTNDQKYSISIRHWIKRRNKTHPYQQIDSIYWKDTGFFLCVCCRRRQQRIMLTWINNKARSKQDKT